MIKREYPGILYEKAKHCKYSQSIRMGTVRTEQEGMEELSRRLCRQLDGLGYSEIMAKIRSQVWRQCDAVILRKDHGKQIQVGSRGEGISKRFESDGDSIIILPYILCIADPRSAPFVSELTTLLVIRNTFPGYCQLEMLRQGTVIDERIVNSLVPFKGRLLLSSKLVNENFKTQLPSDLISKYGVDITRTSMTGPAHTTELDVGLSFDSVITLSSDCHDILQKWSLRPRKCDWPPLNVRQSIQNMKGNLVAAGMKHSETKHLEWRFCFNEIELLLVESLNDTQIKLYKMLKMINTDLLKPGNYQVSSYIMKNLVFWLAETHPESKFCPETLICWIFKALTMLKRAVKLNFIPYYMIPERNLLKEKVSAGKRKPLYDKLSVLIYMGPQILLHCKKISDTRHMIPRDLSLFRDKNFEFEMLHLFVNKRTVEIFSPDAPPEELTRRVINDTKLRQLVNNMMYSARSGWPPNIQEELSRCSKLSDICFVLLS